MDSLQIITVTTHSEYYFPYLVESCKRNGKELTILGYGEKWKGFTWRFRLMLEYLKKLDKNDIVCFIDGYDVICTRDLNELKDEFIRVKNETNCKIIIGHDKIMKDTIFHYLNYLSNINNFGKCKKLSINAGTYIGYVHDLLEILNNIYNLDPNDTADDQKLLVKYCNLYNNDDIYIDEKNLFFLTLDKPYAEIDYLININDNKEIIFNSNKPFFLHAPGQTVLDNTIKLLGYNLNTSIKNKMYKKEIDKSIFEFKNNKIKQVILFIIVLITAIYFWKSKYKINRSITFKPEYF